MKIHNRKSPQNTQTFPRDNPFIFTNKITQIGSFADFEVVWNRFVVREIGIIFRVTGRGMHRGTGEPTGHALKTWV